MTGPMNWKVVPLHVAGGGEGGDLNPRHSTSAVTKTTPSGGGGFLNLL